MKYKKLNQKFFYVIFALFGVLILIGTFFDFQINDSIYMGRDNKFLVFIAAVGVGIPFSGYSLYGGFLLGDARTNKKTWLIKHLFFAFSILLVCLGEYVSADQFAGYNAYNLEESGKEWIAYLIWLPIEAVLFYIGFKQGKINKNKRFCYVCMLMPIMMLLGNIVTVDILKGIMHRPRYRELMDGSGLLNETDYHTWFQPFKDYQSYIDLGIHPDDFKSFPSGHSCSACQLIMILSYLPFVFPKLNIKRNTLFLIGFCYAILIGFSRMLIGAHFLTDVCIGFLSYFIYFFIGNIIIEDKILKEDLI